MSEYLLCLQAQNSDGGILDNPSFSVPNGRQSGLQSTASGDVALCEAYLLLHDIRYLNAAIAGANWQA